MDSPVWSEPLKGSVILATGGRDQEDAPALFEMSHASAVRGVTVWYPEQKPTDIHPHSRSFVSLSDCFLSSTGRKNNPGHYLVEADGGRLQVRGCSFGSDEPGIALRSGLQHAIISENNGVTGVEIVNEIGARAVLANNEPPPQPLR